MFDYLYFLNLYNKLKQKAIQAKNSNTKKSNKIQRKNEANAITFYYIVTVGGSDDSLFFQYDVSLNVSRRTRQLENFYPEATITANTPVLIEFGNQWFYMLTFEIASDDSVTYLAELENFLDNSQIDSFYSPVNRIISIEYSDPQDLENIMQGITFTLNGTHPNADYLEIAELVEFPQTIFH